MNNFTDKNHPEISKLLIGAAIGVLRTDTLYGIVASALHKEAVERLYDVRGREKNKACILLISDISAMFDEPAVPIRQLLADVWPGPVSVIVPAPSAPSYLPRIDGTLAYRVPADEALRRLLQETGPLLAPSANLAGQPPARTIKEATAYFGETVDFYVDSGEVADARPSQLLRFDENGEVVRLR